MDEQILEKENDPRGGQVQKTTMATSRDQLTAADAPPPLSLQEGAAPSLALAQLTAIQEEAYSLERKIEEAERNMKMYECSTRYVEAEKERKNLARLKERRRVLTQHHVENYQRVDAEQLQLHAREQQETFDVRWEKSFVAHNEKTRKMYHNLKERHNGELAKLKADLERKEKERQPKPSTGLLELRTKQRALARCQRYVEAENIRKTADTLEMKEMKGHVSESQRQNQIAVDMMLNQHRIEMNALRQKTKLERKVMREDRNKEQEHLDYRLRNSLAEMTRMHTKQTLVAEGKLPDTGFYTQRGAARSSIPVVGGHLLTSTCARHGTGSGHGRDSGAQHGGRKPLPAILSAEQHQKEKDRQAAQEGCDRHAINAPPLDTSNTNSSRSHKGRARGLKKGRDNSSDTKNDDGSSSASRRQPGRRRKEFSIRNLSRDKKQLRS